MNIHRYNTKKLQSLLGYLLILVAAFIVTSIFCKVKDMADTANLERTAEDSTNRSPTTITSSNTYVWKITVTETPSVPEVPDTMPTRTKPAVWYIIGVVLIVLSIITIIIVKRGGQNAKHRKGK